MHHGFRNLVESVEKPFVRLFLGECLTWQEIVYSISLPFAVSYREKAINCTSLA
jgi:hypothetical protein